MWRVIVAMGLVLGVMVVVTPSTRACSCIDWSPAEHLDHADAAFVGTLISREDPGWGFGEVTWTFEVEQVVKGDLGDTVDVESPIESASCGFGAMGSSSLVGLFHNEHDGEWFGSSCSRVDPDSLLAFAPLVADDPSVPALSPVDEAPATTGSESGSGISAWWFGIGLMTVIVAAGGWGVYRLRG